MTIGERQDQFIKCIWQNGDPAISPKGQINESTIYSDNKTVDLAFW